MDDDENKIAEDASLDEDESTKNESESTKAEASLDEDESTKKESESTRGKPTKGKSKKDKEESEWKKFATMPLEEKRKYYKCKEDYVTLKDIETWTEYFDEQTYLFHSRVPKPGKRAFPFKKELNEKISLWRGDITKLEIDAIVNAANERLLGGGGVDGCIHRASGPTLVKECYLLNGCKTGNTKLTLGHKLPAKYILHTVGPIGKQEDKLESCYESCLRLCLEHEIRTVAFCCISTGIFGYPNKDAAEVALRTTRQVLERNAAAFDRIIFCLFLEKDIEIYHSLMLKYFPPREQEDIKKSEKLKRTGKKEQDEESDHDEVTTEKPSKKLKEDASEATTQITKTSEPALMDTEETTENTPLMDFDKENEEDKQKEKSVDSAVQQNDDAENQCDNTNNPGEEGDDTVTTNTKHVEIQEETLSDNLSDITASKEAPASSTETDPSDNAQMDVDK